MENIWKHVLLEGEFPLRERVLRGLSLDEAGTLPEGANHSLYQELMHLIGWHKVILSGSEETYREWMGGARFPEAIAPSDAAELQARVDEYLADLEAISQAALNADLDAEIGPGTTFGDVYIAMAAHNAHHMGKIVALRQRLGTWPRGGA